MPTAPEELTTEGLRRRWRGYDRAQVQTLLGEVSGDYRAAIERIGTEAHQRARAHRDHQALRARLDDLTAAAHRDAARLRADAEAQAAAIVRRAEHAAAGVLTQADSLRAAAHRDADTARARLEAADARAARIEDGARARWEALRAETEAGFDELSAARRRFDERVRRAESALAALRSQLGILTHIQHAENLLATLRLPAGPESSPESSPESAAETAAGAVGRVEQ
jgi:cell division septum initiation protein DivIVA